jgi:hypothetical protein
MVIYRHSIVITKVMLLYNTEGWHDHGMAVNYCAKSFITLGPGDNVKIFSSQTILDPNKLEGFVLWKFI